MIPTLQRHDPFGDRSNPKGSALCDMQTVTIALASPFALLPVQVTEIAGKLRYWENRL